MAKNKRKFWEGWSVWDKPLVSLSQPKVNRLIFMSYLVIIVLIIALFAIFAYSQQTKDVFLDCVMDEIEQNMDKISEGDTGIARNLIGPQDTIEQSYKLYQSYDWMGRMLTKRLTEQILNKCSSETGYILDVKDYDMIPFDISIQIEPIKEEV